VLQDLQAERGLKTLMVSSALPGEGKTLTIVNLALTLSESYQRRVLLIDADLRHPSIQQAFGLGPGPGLRDDLRSAAETLSIRQVSQNLSVLPAGRADADPMAELGSDRMRPLIQDAASRFDWVLVDTPPVCLLPDAHLVARATDGVLLVISARATPYDLVGRAIAELGHDRIVGTVLNRAEEHALTAKDYYTSDYHRPVMGGA
jgi:capsular exopolysaccharide synthesis family protein